MGAVLKRASLWWAGAVVAGGISPAMAMSGTAASGRIAMAFDQLPLSFEANVGQADSAVDFLCRTAGATLFLSRGDAVLSTRGAGRAPATSRLRLAGRPRHPRGVGLGRQVTATNYLLGNDRRQWHTGVANFAQVRYAEVYPGIDLVYRGSRRQLEFDFVVGPGADPGRIRLSLQGTHALGKIELGRRGELIVHTAVGDLVQEPPVVYQESAADGRREPVAGRYVLLLAGNHPCGARCERLLPVVESWCRPPPQARGHPDQDGVIA